MDDFIPFIRSQSDIQILDNVFSSCRMVRVPGHKIEIFQNSNFANRVWYDPSIDAFENDDFQNDSSLSRFFSLIPESNKLRDRQFVRKPVRQIVQVMAEGLLQQAVFLNSAWISVPQLPYQNNADRNRLNRLFAQSAGEWRAATGYDCSFVLPVILSHGDVYRLSQSRSRAVKLATDCASLSGANILWVVDTSLDDSTGSATLGSARIPRLIDFHQSLRETLPDGTRIIAGPYWATNLLLWARNISDFCAIGFGPGFKYRSPGGFTRRASAKVMLPPLRRLARADAPLEEWIAEAIKQPDLPPSAREGLEEVGQFLSNPAASDDLMWKLQVAKAYMAWISKIARLPDHGRSLGLYQDLSNAFVIGKLLKRALPNQGNEARRPERVAEQFMTHCL